MGELGVESRQKTEVIGFNFGPISGVATIAAGQSLESDIKQSDGYDAIVGVISAVQAFSIEILGAPAILTADKTKKIGPGTFVLLYPLSSVADAESGRQVIVIDQQVLSAYTKIRINAGAALSGIEATVDLLAIYGFKRVEAQVVFPPLSSVSINDAGGGTTEVSVKTPGTPVGPADGSILVGGIDQTGLQQPMEVILDGGGIFRLAVDAILSGPSGSFAQGDFDSLAVNEATATALWVRAAMTGRDTSAAVGSQNVPISARNFDLAADISMTLVGLLTNSRMAGYSNFNGDWRSLSVQTLTFDGQGLFSLLTTDARESAYPGTFAGRRFSFTHQTPGTLITAQATFVATTPTLLIYNSAGNISTLILRTVRIAIREATTAPVFVCVAIDTADRFSAGGTLIVGQNWNEGSVVAFPGTAFRFNPTASAAGAGTRYLWTDLIPAGDGASITINFKDGVRISGVGSILIYVWDSAGANAPDIVEDVEVEAF